MPFVPLREESMKLKLEFPEDTGRYGYFQEQQNVIFSWLLSSYMFMYLLSYFQDTNLNI